MRNTGKRSVPILFKTISKNFGNILRLYPKMMWVADHPKKYSEDERYEFCMFLIKTLIESAGVMVRAFGLENIPAQDGFYVCANHQEKFDPLAIWYTFPRKIGVILDDRATHRPFIREVCKLVRSKKLHYRRPKKIFKAISEVTEELKNFINYMVFPEGNYEEVSGVLSEFHAGSFKSPKNAKCPIVPVAIIDSYKIFDRGFTTTLPIQVHYLKPIMPVEFEKLTTSQIAELVKSRIQAVLDKFQKK
ncbi:MAG: 1-acyl-sn-glycerol-3-phosphate acyltransferase [Treponema sp.]|nr:1-acyl-sn-glycerol-3-phosphate acyltransferase [Treponema sp.]